METGLRARIPGEIPAGERVEEGRPWAPLALTVPVTGRSGGAREPPALARPVAVAGLFIFNARLQPAVCFGGLQPAVSPPTPKSKLPRARAERPPHPQGDPVPGMIAPDGQPAGFSFLRLGLGRGGSASSLPRATHDAPARPALDTRGGGECRHVPSGEEGQEERRGQRRGGGRGEERQEERRGGGGDVREQRRSERQGRPCRP